MRWTRWRRGSSTAAGAIRTIDADRLDALLHPAFARDAEYEVLAEGVAASPGAAKGAIVFTAAAAVAAAEHNRDVIIVRPFTEADDVAGFHAAKRDPHLGGGQGQPCRAGGARDGQALRVGRERRWRSTCRPSTVRVGGTQLGEGDLIVIDGSAGLVTVDDVPLEEPEVSDEFQTVLAWADELRTLGVRANADTPEDAAKAREFGAERGRPLPDRAHVHGRGPPAEDARR